MRERIRDERTVRQSRSVWRAGLAAAAAVALVATFASRAWRTEEAPRGVRTATDIALPVVATQPEVQATRLPPALQGPRQARPTRARAVTAATVSDGPSRPDVLVSGDQLRALARLRELTLNGELTEKNLPPAASDPGAMTDIRIAPLTIAPLTLPGVEIVSGPTDPEDVRRGSVLR